MTISSLITAAEAEALAVPAAMRLGVPVSVWADATTTSQEAALQAATATLYAEPGLQFYGREDDGAVQLACTIQALHLLDLQSDSGAQERRRLQDGGVSDVQSGRIREQYRPRHSGLCVAARQVLMGYRGTVNLA